MAFFKTMWDVQDKQKMRRDTQNWRKFGHVSKRNYGMDKLSKFCANSSSAIKINSLDIVIFL